MSATEKRETRNAGRRRRPDMSMPRRDTRRLAKLVPRVTFPRELPICEYRLQIQAACAAHQVVIVAGETGSGKTTQIPKMLLELGYGVRGMIGCTQPRRIAATSVARRVADELCVLEHKLVGHQVRFDNRTGPDTLIKFMTDGILLAETRTDPKLLAYDAIIIDEVHERSLNIDFLLGYLKRLLARRPDLKVVISSATLDVERFSEFFDDAPIIEVPGRTFPVEVVYRDPTDEDGDLASEIGDAVDEITQIEPRGDILVFLSGERDIQETARLLEGRRLPDTEVIPLYARLPAAQQRRAFKTSCHRRIILSTNVAETSVTIPGVHVVIDPGLARVKRYNPRTQVEKLHVEKISQASANQRKGRCGRIGPGVCVRLYAEEDLGRRAEYTDPEIKRSSLAGVILAMLDLRLGLVEDFPFLDPPTPASIRDGYRELKELGALEGRRKMSELGRKLTQFSVEPRLGRMLVEASRNKVLPDVLTVVAALSTDDPRLRPPDKRDEADKQHARYAVRSSDFAAFLKLWRSLREARRAHASQSRFRAYCRGAFLSFRRIREWESVREQLEDECRRARLKIAPGEANEERLHRSLLPGLLNKVGLKDERGRYRGARGVRFYIHPGSCLAGRSPEWVVAAELVETSRLFGRSVGAIDPEWIEPVAEHICKRTYGPPYWDAETGFVRAEETVLLYGLPIVSGRPRHFGPVDPATSREIFIQHALVNGELHAPPPVVRRNLAVMARVAALEAKVRRQDIMIAESEVFEFYAGVLPDDIYSGRGLKKWLHREGRTAEQAMTLTEDFLKMREPDDVMAVDYPDELGYEGQGLHLDYHLARGEEEDGITCRIPVAALQDLPDHPFDWLVPGFLPEKIHALFKGLPKRLRREFVPINRTVDAVLQDVEPNAMALPEALSEWALRKRGIRIAPSEWGTDLPRHLAMRFLIEDEDGQPLASGRDLNELKQQVGATIEESVSRPHTESDSRKDNITEWDFGDLPEVVDVGQQGWKVLQYPGLEDFGDSVTLRRFDTPREAHRHTAYGLVRLTMLALPRDVKQLKTLPRLPQGAVGATLFFRLSEDTIRDHVIRRAIADACGFLGTDVPRNADAFVERIYAGKTEFYTRAREFQDRLVSYLESAVERLADLESLPAALREPATSDIRAQLAGLFGPDFILHTPTAWWIRYPQYLGAIARRLERLRLDCTKDTRRQAELTPFLERLSDTPPHADGAALEQYRWMLEEWRISLFAQELGTRFPVSAKRLEKQWAKVGV